MAMKPKLDAYLSGEPVDQTDYPADHAGMRYNSQKALLEVITVPRLISLVIWMQKSKTVLAMSSADAEYVAIICKLIHKDGDGDALFQLKSDSLPHAHAQTTKTYYKHRDTRIMKAQELKTKTSSQTLIYKIFLQRYQVYQGRLLASFQDDAKYERVGQDTRSQGGKDDQVGRIKI
ncbi:hypothetical protein Tco_0867812 [Tanacetum coccineum]